MFDFSNEQEQRVFGPVPADSIVMLEIEVLQPAQERQAAENPYISAAQSGLRQIYCQFTVAYGTYQGVTFRQNITLPIGAQRMTQLTDGQRRACNIGGATIKAICQASRKNPKMQDVTMLSGSKFPARVKINPRPSEKDGRTYWNNELDLVITPDKDSYAHVCNGGEIITDGPTKGNAITHQSHTDNRRDEPPADIYDNDAPF